MRWMSFVFAVGIPLIARTACAISFLYPVGHFESLSAGVGNAFLGSAAGLVYNPASLGGIHSASLSASGSSYFLIREELNSGAGQVFSFNSVPNSTLSTWKWGEGSLVVGIVVPSSAQVQTKAQLTLKTDSPLFGKAGTTVDIDNHTNLSRTLVGVAWGQKIMSTRGCPSCGWYGGVSILGSYDTSQQTMSAFASTPAAGAGAGSLIVQDLDSSATSLLLASGLIWHLSPGWNLGLRLQLPSVLLATSVNGVGYAQTYNPASTPIAQNQRVTGGNNPQNLEQWNSTLGVEWQASSRWIFLADASLGERSRSLNSDNSRAPISTGVAARYLLKPTMALVTGVNASLSDMFIDDRSQDVQSAALLATIGLMWRKRDFETGVGLFDYQRVIFSIPDAVKNDPDQVNAASVLYTGLMLSGLYHF